MNKLFLKTRLSLFFLLQEICDLVKITLYFFKSFYRALVILLLSEEKPVLYSRMFYEFKRQKYSQRMDEELPATDETFKRKE